MESSSLKNFRTIVSVAAIMPLLLVSLLAPFAGTFAVNSPLKPSPNVAPSVQNTFYLPNNTLYSGNVLTTIGQFPVASVFDSHNGFLYVVAGQIFVIDLTTSTIVKNITVGVRPL
ncbi:MAG: hypothetical protein ACHQ1H_05810, partial [Nitrososphaerales archaeon]